MPSAYPSYLLGNYFSINLVNTIFIVASILLFVAIVLTINRIRHRFSATGWIELGVLLLLFVVAADAQIRILIYQYLLASIIHLLLLTFTGGT